MGSANLHGVLNMPIGVWGDDYVDKVQRAARYIEASKLIDKLESENADLRAQHAERVRTEGVRIDVSLLDADGTDYVPHMKQLIADHGTAPAALRVLLDFHRAKK